LLRIKIYISSESSASSSRKKERVFGARTSGGNSTVKSGVQIVQKAVVHVDNLDIDCTPTLLTDYLLANDNRSDILLCSKIMAAK